MSIGKKANKRMILGFYCMIAIAFLLAFIPPYLKLQDLKKERDKLQAQMEEIKLKKIQLEEQKEYLLSDAYIEQVARQELGLVRAGEVVIMRAKPGNALPLERGGTGYNDIRD